MAVPTVTVRVDWANDGAFTQAIDDVSSRVRSEGLTWTRGRNADFSGEATGAASFTLRNDDDRFTPDRNWCDNPSFEADTAGWSTAASIVTAASTSITQVTDNAGQGGTKAGEAVLTAVSSSGVTLPIPYTFRSGVTYSVRVWLKSVSGNLNVDSGIGSLADSDWGYSTGAITTSWASKSFTWTPAADRAGATLWVRTTTAAAATLRIDAIQINPGASANTYLEAPTKGQLIPGRPVHIYATYSATDYPQFYGYIERLTPDPRARTVTITCYDLLRRLGEVEVVVPATAITRWNRDYRTEALGDFERGSHNLVSNPDFATNTAGWGTNGTSFSRVTGETGLPSGLTTAGEYICTSSTQLLYHDVRMAPIIPTGVTYRLSAYMRVPSGSSSWKLTLQQIYLATQERDRIVNLTTTWQRVTLTFKTNETTSASSNVFRAIVKSVAGGGGTVRIGAVSLTRGPELHAYSGVGTGRWPNWVGNAGMATASGWLPAFMNRCLNADFESDASGWTGTADWTSVGSLSVARSTTYAYLGSASLQATHSGASQYEGAKYEVTGTFKAGVQYQAYAFVRSSTGTVAVRLCVGDYATDWTQYNANATTTWAQVGVTWTPAADRTSVAVGFCFSTASAVTYWDGVYLAEAGTGWSLTGPGGGAMPATTCLQSSSAHLFGPNSMEAVTSAVAPCGIYYDFAVLEPYFVAGRSYTASVWLYCATGSLPYRVGVGSNNLTDGTWDDASTTGTASTGTWTKVSATWTPATDHSSLAGRSVLFVYQTDATARAFYVAGPRCIPGSTADDFEMTQWDLGVEDDIWSATGAFSGSGLSVLGEINALSLTRHWISATMASPWYAYTTRGRTEVAASAETYNDDVADMSAAEIDRNSIVNTVGLTHLLGIEYYSDPASVATYGVRSGRPLNGATVWSDAWPYADTLGAALVARYKDPRARPTITVVNRFPSLLQRQPDDLVTVNLARLRIAGGKYLIQSMTTTVSAGGLVWRTTYQLEEYPY